MATAPNNATVSRRHHAVATSFVLLALSLGAACSASVDVVAGTGFGDTDDTLAPNEGDLAIPVETGNDPITPPIDSTPILIEAGDEPRQPIRYLVESSSGTFRQSFELEISAAGRRVGPIAMTVDQTYTVDAGPGLLEIVATAETLEITDAGNAGSASDLQDQLDGLVGVTETIQIDTLGNKLSSEISGNDRVGAELSEALDIGAAVGQLSTPFPADPVGIGARWSVEQEVVSADLRLVQVLTYELLERTDTTVTLELAVSQTIPPQFFDDQGIEGDLRGSGRGQGRVVIDLADVGATRSEATLTTTVSSTTVGEPVEIETTVAVTVAPL